VLRDNKIDLFVAIQNYTKTKSLSEIIQLVTSGADLTVTNSDKKTPMQVLADLKLWECINVIAGMKADEGDKARYGDAFLTAVKEDKLDTASILIKARAKITWYNTTSGNRCLHWAVKNRNLKMIELLLNAGAFLEEVNQDKQTAMQLAAALGYWDCVKLMADTKKTDETDAFKYTDVLFTAIKTHQASPESDHIEVITSLIAAGADLAALNADKTTPIQLAKILKHWDCVVAIAKAKKTCKTDIAHYGSPLIIAVSNNDYDTAKVLLEAGASTTWYTSDDENRCLHWAVKNRNIKLIELLLKHNSDLTTKNKKGKTPIQLAAELEYWDCVETIAKKNDSDDKEEAAYGDAVRRAVIKGQLNTVKVLVKAKAPVTWQTTSTKMTCLHEAVCQDNNLEMVQLLLSNGANIAAVNTDDRTPIMLAASKKQWTYVEAIANSQKIDEQDTVKYGAALYYAVYYDNLKIAELLLKAKAPVTWFSADDKNYLLHIAVTNNNPKMIELLLTSGADLHGKNKGGQTPLELACALGKWDCVDVFMRDKKFKFKDSVSAGLAFIDAIKAGRLDVATYLLSAGASATECTKTDAFTALHWAVNQNNPKAIRYLLERINLQTTLSNSDETPIELASRLSHWDCVQDLLEAHPARDKTQKIVENLHYENTLLNAIKGGNYAIARLLLEHHAPCSRCNSEWGNIALYWAVKNNKPAIIELLRQYGADATVKNKDAKTLHALAKELGFTACVIALDKDNQNEFSCDVLTSISKRDKLFESIKDNAVAAADIPGTLNMIEKINQSILRNDIVELNARRETLRYQVNQSNQSYESTYANLLSNTNKQQQMQQLEIENINTLIKVMNTLVKFPDSVIPAFDLYTIGEMQKMGSVEADHVMTIVDQIQKIRAYVSTLSNWLDQLEKKINSTSWKKNLIPEMAIAIIPDVWIDGIPDHVQDLKKELAKINSSNTASEIITIYAEIVKIFLTIGESSRRHPDTAQFYKINNRELAKINFADSQLPSTQYPFATNVQYQNDIQQTSSLYQTQVQQQPISEFYFGELAGTNYPLSVSQIPLPTLPPSYEASIENKRMPESQSHITSLNHSELFQPTAPSIYPSLKDYSSFVPVVTQNFPQEQFADWKLPLFSYTSDSINLNQTQSEQPTEIIEVKESLLLPLQPTKVVPIEAIQVNANETIVVQNALIENQQNDLLQEQLTEKNALIGTLTEEDKKFNESFPLIPKQPLNMFNERSRPNVEIKQNNSQNSSVQVKQYAM